MHGSVHYKEPLESFEIRVRHSPGFGLPSCRDIAMPQCADSDVKQYSLTYLITILLNSIALTSSIFTKLADIMKYEGGVLIKLFTEWPFKTVSSDVTEFHRI